MGVGYINRGHRQDKENEGRCGRPLRGRPALSVSLDLRFATCTSSPLFAAILASLLTNSIFTICSGTVTSTIEKEIRWKEVRSTHLCGEY